MTLTELKTLVENFVESSETTFVASLDDFIKSAEDRIFELVQSDFFKKTVSGNVTTGNRFLTCPTDFVLSISLAVIDGNSDYHYLSKKHSSFMQEYSKDIADSSLRGLPKYYADYDQDTHMLAPTPNAALTVELAYTYKPPVLSSTTTSNWVSQNAPNVLLYGCIIEALGYLKGPADMIQYYDKMYNQSVQALATYEMGRDRRDEFRDGVIRIPLESRNP